MITETIPLANGIRRDGKTHKTVIMRVPIVKDSLEVEAELAGAGALTLSLGLLGKRIVSFGGIPKEQITVDLLAELTETDLARLQEATEMLKKKADWSNGE